jgi:hypothetical protein
MLLCDAAQEVNGKLYVLGGGWTRTLQSVPPVPVMMALALKVFVSWNETNVPHEFTATLFDDDGNVVSMDDKPVQLRGRFEVGRPPGATHGADLDQALAVTFGGLLLPSGRYKWEFAVGGRPLAAEQFEVIAPKG